MKHLFGIAIFVLVLMLALSSCDILENGTNTGEPGNISGYVDVEDGASRAGVEIKATSSDGNYVYDATSNKYGFFSIEDVTPGQYTITFSKSGYITTEKSFTVKGGRSLDTGTVTLAIRYGFIKGKVTDEKGNPLAGATVTVTGTGLKYSGTTDASGKYTIQAKPGKYTAISIAAPCHYLQESISTVTVKSDADSTIKDYQLEKNHKFEIYDMKEATTTATGYRKYRCADCGETKDEILPVVVDAKWAGVRVSSYGMAESFGRYPGVEEMTGFAAKMESCYEGSTGTYILIVATVDEDVWTCNVGFPLSREISMAHGSETDLYEDYLTAFDNAGYSVWLQVEPGNADLVELATEVMNRYSKHSCVKGFGIDVEWYKPEGTNGRGTKLSEEPNTVTRVLSAVKAVNSDYTVFVKHWDERWLPDAREGLIYVNDSQGFRGGLSRMCEEFADWAEHFNPCPVMFQIGYESDKSRIWGSMDNPAQEVGKAILDACETDNYKGIIWVDFTLKEVMDKID